MAKYIIAGRTNSLDGYSISSSPKIHTNKSVAETEAVRLASLSPGKEYVVLELISAHKVQTATRIPV